MPSSLFCWDVDKWEVETSNQICLGVLHEVRIRSLDRLKLKYNLYRENWKNKWRIVQKCRNPIGQFFPSNCNCDVNTLTGQLQDETMVGLIMKAALKSGYKEMALALYYSGTPIALWYRCEPHKSDCETQLNHLLQDRLLYLPYRVFTKPRQQHHISLLWDDPNPILPDYQLQ